MKKWDTRKKIDWKVTLKQKRFVEEYIKTWNATESASKVYNVNNKVTAWSVWYENLNKPQIKELIEIKEAERVKIAKDMIFTIATTGEKEDTRIKACQDIIDRIEWKASANINLWWQKDNPLLIGDITEEQKKKIALDILWKYSWN